MNKLNYFLILVAIYLLPNYSNACHLVTITETNAVDNGDGTYTYTFDICVGIEDTYGFYLSFTGANLISYPGSVTGPTTGNTINASSPPVSGTGNLEYGDWDSNGGLLFSGVGNECVSMSFTFDGSISQVDIAGTQAFYVGGPCAGVLTTTTCFPATSTYTISISASNSNNQFYGFALDGTTLVNGIATNGQTDTWYYCGPCASTFSVVASGGASIPSWNVVETGAGSLGSGASEVSNASLTPCVPLPVELLYFNGANENCENTLSWSTQSERENDYFLVERSHDGTNWEDVAHVKGAGNSTEQLYYSITDASTIQKQLSYYRLTQVDSDGKSELFKMISVENKCATGFTSHAYPNPMLNELNVVTEYPANVSITDVQGATLQQMSFDRGQHTIDVSDLTSGAYFVVIRSGDQENTQKFIKK